MDYDVTAIFGPQYGGFRRFITQSKRKRIAQAQDPDNVKEKDR